MARAGGRSPSARSVRSLLGGLTSIGLVLVGRAGRKTRIPFGPFMLAGALLAVLLGEPLAGAYQQFTGI